MPVLAYGQFLTQALNFLIIALCIFLVINMFQKAADKITRRSRRSRTRRIARSAARPSQ